MTRYVFRIAARALTPVVDVETTKSEIAGAVRSGGDFVEFRAGERVVQVLVTPTTPITIEELDDLPTSGATVSATAGPPLSEWSFPDFDEWDS